MGKIKPTNKEPISPQSKEFEKDFKKSMVTHNLNIQETQEKLNEIDGMLSETEQSLKKKIFSLAKMETLVFNDPKLSAVYDEMAGNGEEKYGYHYNETIQNMIFNDYVLNSPQYLQKYKNSVPKEKKRRDKSGINQLKKAGQKKIDATGTKIEDNTPKDVEESTTAGSAGAAAGYVGYAGPAAWSKKGNLMGNAETPKKISKPIANMTTISESNYLTDTSGFEKYVEMLNEETDADFASTKHKGLPEKVNEEFYDKIVKIEYFDKVGQLKTLNTDEIPVNDLNTLAEKPINLTFTDDSEERVTYDEFIEVYSHNDDNILNINNENSEYLEKKGSTPQRNDKLAFSDKNIKEDTQTMIQNNGTSMSNKAQATGDMSSEVPTSTQTTGGLNEAAKEAVINMLFKNQGFKHMMKTEMIQNIRNVIGKEGIDTSNISDDDILAISNELFNNSEVPVGTQQTGGLDESDIKLLEEINKELEAFSIHHNKLKIMSEERKTNSQILNARVGTENEKNFKKDFKNSDTKDVINVEKELEWEDQQTDVPKDPQKLGQDIEKQAIKNTDMKSDEALKNVGNSTNDDGDEIPKRNLTSDEQDEIDLYRNGQHSLNYDNEPSERFIERQKADQGEFFEMGEKQKEFKANAPAYNKDSQPVDDGIEKVQHDKNKSGWNERKGLKESMVTGRYIDILGKRRLIEFRLNEVKNLTTPSGTARQTGYFELDFTGLGNTYLSKSVDKKVIVNEAVVNAMNSSKFYTDGKNVVAMKNPTKSLNEGKENEEKAVINEQVNKMKHLLGYKPDSFTNTNNVKKNRGF